MQFPVFLLMKSPIPLLFYNTKIFKRFPSYPMVNGAQMPINLICNTHYFVLRLWKANI